MNICAATCHDEPDLHHGLHHVFLEYHCCSPRPAQSFLQFPPRARFPLLPAGPPRCLHPGTKLSFGSVGAHTICESDVVVHPIMIAVTLRSVPKMCSLVNVTLPSQNLFSHHLAPADDTRPSPNPHNLRYGVSPSSKTVHWVRLQPQQRTAYCVALVRPRSALEQRNPRTSQSCTLQIWSCFGLPVTTVSFFIVASQSLPFCVAFEFLALQLRKPMYLSVSKRWHHWGSSSSFRCFTCSCGSILDPSVLPALLIQSRMWIEHFRNLRICCGSYSSRSDLQIPH